MVNYPYILERHNKSLRGILDDLLLTKDIKDLKKLLSSSVLS